MKGIITLCGSTKFKKEFELVNRDLTIAGWIVLSVGSYHNSEPDPIIRQAIIDAKDKLDELHLQKIAISQAVLIIDVKGYIGRSTESELGYAKLLGKTIYYWSLGDHIKLSVGTIPKTS